MAGINRRNAVKKTLAGMAATFMNAQKISAGSVPTPADLEGPFYPSIAQKDTDYDLTQINGNDKRADGEIIIIDGRVMDIRGSAITGAKIELWQANAAGRYAHPDDKSKAKMDPNFQGWAILRSNKDGRFHIKTIKPGAYAIGKNRLRTPHIHFKASKSGFQPIITQMYFPDENELNLTDMLLQKKSKDLQSLMIARQDNNNNPYKCYTYNLILANIGGTAAPQHE